MRVPGDGRQCRKLPRKCGHARKKGGFCTMGRRRHKLPKSREYRKGAVSDVYTHDNRRTTVHFPGAFESEGSLAAYSKLLDTLRANGGRLPPPDGDVDPEALTI